GHPGRRAHPLRGDLMARLFRWAGDGLPANAALLPGQSGAGDPPLSRGMITGVGLGAKMSMTQPGSRPRVGFDNWILFEDWAIDGRNRLEFKFDEAPHMHNPVPPEALPLTRYSMRCYFRMGADPELWGLGPYRLFSFADGHEGYSWSYYLSDGTL